MGWVEDIVYNKNNKTKINNEKDSWCMVNCRSRILRQMIVDPCTQDIKGRHPKMTIFKGESVSTKGNMDSWLGGGVHHGKREKEAGRM